MSDQLDFQNTVTDFTPQNVSANVTRAPKPVPAIIDDEPAPGSPRDILREKITYVAEHEASVQEAVTARDKAFEKLAEARTELSRARMSDGLPVNDALIAQVAEGALDDMNSTQDARAKRIADLEAAIERWTFVYEQTAPIVDQRRQKLDLARLYRDNAAKAVVEQVVEADVEDLEKKIEAARSRLAVMLGKVEAIKNACEHNSPLYQRTRSIMNKTMDLGRVEQSPDAMSLKQFVEKLKTDADAVP